MSFLGHKHTPETLAKMSKWQKGPRSPKQIAALKAVNAAKTGRNRTPKEAAQLKVLHASNVGRHHTAETIERMSAAAVGRKCSPETCARISAAHKVENLTPEVRANISAGQKRRLADPTQNPAWLGGVSRAPYAWTFNEELKEEVRRRDGHRCQLCGVPQAENKWPLSIHHIDYNKKNSDPVNLVTLCRCCHGKTTVNRKHWTEVFQAVAIKRSIAELGGTRG